MSLKKAVARIKKHKNFLITSHTNLEGDALGSELAFSRLLQKLGKGTVIVNEDDYPPQYAFLPDINKMKKFRSNIKGINFDCLAFLDCSDFTRSGEVFRLNKANKPTLNIDHHISNSRFADTNWIDACASSCSEMIYQLYRALRIPLDRESAVLLYAGILTDTGSFRYSNTTSFTHKAISELLKFNLDIPGIYKNIYESIPFEDAQLFSKILPQMRREAQGRIIWFQLKRGILRNKKLSFDLSEHILSFGRAIEDAQVVVLFKENLSKKNEVRVNFRSHGKVDVNAIAGFFGGGGHKTASGATIHGKIDDVRRKVLAKINQALK
ncbi:MAG: bifunctional oligoribonuclease/PAP phosphatase NrnA [Candidatus Omnitrophota bacterium]